MKQLLGSLAIQLLAFVLVLGGLFLGLISLSAVQAAIVIASLAAFLAWVLRLDRWWILIHGLFPPAVIFGLEQAIPPYWYLVAFLALALFYLPTVRSRVPLFLSNAKTVAALGEIIGERFPKSSTRVLDFGCGNGVVISRLARASREKQYVGIEAALIPFVIAKLRTWRQPNVTVRYGDFWSIDLADFDVVYTFLSPTPMPRVWRKVQQEMGNGGLLISNSFPVPGKIPDQVISVTDARKTQLYLYVL